MKSFKIILIKVLLFALLPLMLGACEQKEGKVLSQKKMAAVLTDVYLTEAILQNVDKKKKTDWSQELRDEFFQDLAYRRILEKHRISEKDFYTSVAHYSQQYKVYAKIYQLVELNLKALQDEVSEREKLQTQLRELAREQARLIAALDTSSYIKWFEIWVIDSVSMTDSRAIGAESDSLVLKADSLQTLPFMDFKKYETSFWPKSLVQDTCNWTVVEFKPIIKNEQPELPGTKAVFREGLKKEFITGED
ncbi:MAG: DUF4296 domain-containing protein [Bacteroidales bacterium]